jgi:hypothetical protein
MTEYKGNYQGNPKPETTDERCDIRVWSDSCRRSEQTDQSDKYLCAACGSVPVLHHEMHHEHFPHLCGDEDELS